jgi:hypothetical protein
LADPAYSAGTLLARFLGILMSNRAVLFRAGHHALMLRDAPSTLHLQDQIDSVIRDR